MEYVADVPTSDLLTLAQRDGLLTPYVVDVPFFAVAPGQNVSVTHCAQANVWIDRILAGEARGDSLGVQVDVADIPLYPETGQAHRVTAVDPETGRWMIYQRPPEDRRITLVGQSIRVTIHGEPRQDPQDHMISIYGDKLDPETMMRWMKAQVEQAIQQGQYHRALDLEVQVDKLQSNANRAEDITE